MTYFSILFSIENNVIEFKTEFIIKFLFIFVICNYDLDKGLEFSYSIYFIFYRKMESNFLIISFIANVVQSTYDIWLSFIATVLSFIFQWVGLFPEFFPFFTHNFKWSHILWNDISLDSELVQLKSFSLPLLNQRCSFFLF